MEVSFHSEIDASLRHVQDFLDRLGDENVKQVFTDSKEHFVQTYMQVLFRLKFPRHLQKTLYEILLTHAAATEKLGPGGFRRFFELMKDSSVSISEIGSAFLPSLESLTKIVDLHTNLGDRTTSEMVKQAIRLAGFGGKIIVEKTQAIIPSVELVCGYTFDLTSALLIDCNFLRPRVVCIDGYIENVSELHHLLEASAASKEPCVLFVRGMSDDVKHTLKVNYDRGSLRVVPMIVKFDLEGMNTLVDLAVVSGSDLISSLKGDLISSIDYASLKRVDQITVFRGRTVVTATTTKKSVLTHVTNLRNRRNDQKIEDVGSLLDKRIKSLSPNHVVIRVPDDNAFVKRSQAIDYALRALKSAIEFGVDGNNALVATELAARHHAKRCKATLDSIGCVLIDS